MAKIFWTKIPEETSFLEWGALLKKVSFERGQRIKRFIHEKDKLLSLTSELLLRYILKREYNYSGESIAFSYNEYGKPFLQESALHFNLSHSGKMVVLAIDTAPIGIDVEQQRENIDLSVDRLVFSDKEREVLSNSATPIDTFYQLWTRKEAYIKQCGRGFSLDTKSFTLLPDMQEILSLTGGELRVETYSLEEEYYISCVTEYKNSISYDTVNFSSLIM